MNLPLAIIAHLIGDFLFQNHWMQLKASDGYVCFVHVAAYAIPFVALAGLGLLPLWVLAAILVQHFAQDRWALHLRWMRFFQQTPPSLWPIGPLFVDQSWHLAFIGFFYCLTLL